MERETSHTTILPRRYAQRSRWWQCLVSRHFPGNVVIVDGSDLSALLGIVNFQISNLYLHGFTILLPQPLCTSTVSFISGIGFFSPFFCVLSSA